MWWLIGLVVVFFAVRHFWRVWTHPAAVLVRQAVNMGWVGSGTLTVDGYRNTKLSRDGMTSVVWHKDQNVELIDPPATHRFKDFVELERWLASDPGSEPDTPEMTYMRDVDDYIRSLGHYDNLVLPAQTVEPFLAACAVVYKAGFETGTSTKVVGMHIAEGANKFNHNSEFGILYLQNIAKGLGKPKAREPESDPKEEERRSQRQAAAQAAKKELRENMLKAVRAIIVDLPAVESLPREGEAVLTHDAARQKWQPLRAFADRLRTSGEGADVAGLLADIPDVKVKPGFSLVLVSSGTERDGYYDVPGIAEALIYAPTLEGLLAAFYMRVGIVPQLAWGHGCYDRDAALVTSLDEEISLLVQSVKQDRPEIAKLTVPPGIRVSQADGVLTARCMAYRPGKGLYDFAVALQRGTAAPLQETELFKWGGGVFY